MINSNEYEVGIIGCILQDPAPSLFACKKHSITESSFQGEVNREIWRAIQKSKTKTGIVDALTVAKEMDTEGCDPSHKQALMDAIDAVPSVRHCDYYATELRKVEQARLLEQCTGRVYSMLADGGMTAEEASASLRNGINEAMSIGGLGVHKIGDVKDAKLSEWERAMKGGSVGIPFSACPTVSQYTLGWRRSVMSIIAAYRSTGKSTLLRQDAMLNAKLGYHVGLFSLEDPLDIVCASMVCFDMNKSMVEYDSGNAVELDSIRRYWESMDLPLYISANPMSIDKIESTIEVLHERHELDVVYIDHLQYIQPYIMRGCSRNDTMAQYSLRLCSLAKRYGFALVCASQFSRACESENRKPRMSDLRDSGSLEQDARQIILLYWNPDENCYCVEVAKNNSGRQGYVQPLIRNAEKHKFEEIHMRTN